MTSGFAANLFGRQGYPKPVYLQLDLGALDGVPNVLAVNTTDQIRLKNLWDLDLRLAKSLRFGSTNLTLAGEIFNAGFENQTVNELATIAKKVVEQEFPEKAPIKIEKTTTNDPRSYRITSRKITEKLGWSPKRNIEDAARDLCAAFKAGKFPTDTLKDESYVNVKTVKALGLK